MQSVQYGALFTASLTAGKLGRDWTMADLRETVDG